MTQISPQQTSTASQEDPHLPPTAASGEHSDMSDSQPNSEPASENEAGDVRKKLKQTSLQQIPKLSATESPHAPRHRDVNASSDSTMTHGQDYTSMGCNSDNAEDPRPEDSRLETAVKASEPDARGRTVVKKRSREDMEFSNDGGVQSAETEIETATIHARKRSRDIRSGEVKSEIRKPIAHNNSLKEEDETRDAEEPIRLSSDERKSSIEMTTPPSETEGLDHEMHETVLSPKKKRSRDEMDAETDKEQKLASTEKTKRRRSSSEENRIEHPRIGKSDSNEGKESIENGSALKPQDPSDDDEARSTSNKIPPISGFANTSAVSPFGTLTGGKSPTKPLSSFSSTASSQQTQPLSSAFAASSFAALSNASASPFGALGASSAKGLKGPSFSPPLLSSPFTPTFKLNEDASKPSGFAALVEAQMSGFGSSSVSGFGVFGTSTSFAGGFGGGSKLSSFAAPQGDATLGSTTVKPISGVADEDGVEQNDEEAKGDASTEIGLENDEPDPRFQVQEVNTGEEHEDTICQVQGKIYEFNGIWGERGQGLLKLNVERIISEEPEDSEEPEGDFKPKARFIMRNNMTHKVLLNTPIFKAMNLTIAAGGGGRVMFSSISGDGKPIPYLFRCHKEDTIKALIREVEKIQEQL